METKKAYIRWTHLLHNRKKLPIGIQYFPHIVRENDPDQVHWSVSFAITEENYKNSGVIEFAMLIDNDETRAFFDTLIPNTRFVLLEAFTEVAKGIIL